MPGPFHSSQYRTAKRARASASPSKPSASSSSRLDAGGSSLKTTSKTTSSAASSTLCAVKSTSKSNAANALKAKLAQGKVKPHSSFKPSSTKPRLNLNSNGVSKAQVREIAENTEKARQAALQDIAKSKAKEKEKEKDKSAMVGSSTTARRSSTAAAGSNPGSARQNATASSSSSSVPQAAPSQTAPMPVQGGAAVGGVPMYYPAPVNIMYPQVPYPQPQPFVPNANRRGSAYYNALPSPVEAPAAATMTFQANTPATAPSPTAPVNVGVLHQDLTSLYHASDQLFGRMASVLQVQETQGRTTQAMQGQVTALVESQGEDRRAMQAGFDLILKELREEREESRQWRQAHTKLCGALAGDQTTTRKEVAEVGKWLGRPKDERDSRSLFERMEGVEWGIGEIGLILGDPEANMPEGSDSVQRPPRPLVQSQPEPGPSAVTPRQLNTRDEPIEIDMDEPSVSTTTSTPSVPISEPHQQPQVQPQEPEQQPTRSSTSAPSSTTAPDLHTLLGLNTGVPPHSSQSSALHSPHEAFDFDLEYPPDSSQAGATPSQKRRSKTPEPSPSRIALDEGAQEEDEKDEETETPMLVEEERSKTPEPDPLRAATLAVQRTPTQASIVPSSSSTSTLAASTSATTALSTSTSTCTRDKSTLHFSRVDWNATEPSPIVSTTPPYKPDAETLSKTPIEKRVSSTVPPPPPGTVAELRLEIVGCAPFVGSGLTLDRNDQLVVEGPGGQTSDAGASTHVPLVTRPSVSPLPSPATTPSQSRAATPVGMKRTESMSTVVVEEEEDSMQVDDSVTREDDPRMQNDGAQRADPTLDILARNLKEVQNLEEERKRIEAELAQEKARKDKEEEEEQRKREVEAAEEKKRTAAEEAEKAEKERVEREREEARLKAEAEAKEEAERERRDRELAEVLRLRRIEAEAEREKQEEALRVAKLEAERKEREDEERLEEEARVRREEAERAKAEADMQAFEQEEKERREAIEQQVKARFDAEAEEQRKKRVEEEKEKAVQQEEEGEEVLGGKVYDVLRGQEEPVQDDQQEGLGYDLELDLEPQSGIDPIYTQLGGPTPAQSQQSINLLLSPEIMPASTPALPCPSPVRPLIAASSYEAFTVESILSSQEDIEVPDKVDDKVDTSDEGEQDELQEDHDMDQLDSTPTSPIFGSSFNFNTTPHDSEGAQNKGESGTEKVAAQNRTINYTPKSFLGARSQPLLEIVNNSPQRSRGNVDGEDDEKLEKRAATDSMLVVLGPEEDEASRRDGGRGDMLPPPSPSFPLGDGQHDDDDDDDEAMDETYAAGAVFAVHDPPTNDIDEDELPLAGSPQEQLFLPGDDDDELSFPPSRPKSSLSQQVQTRGVSEEVPEATSTPKPKAAPKPVSSAPGSISKTTSASISASTHGPPRTPSRTRAYSGMSTPIHLSAGSGLGGRMDSHPASKTLVPTPSRKGALSRRLEEESRNRERSNSVASSIVVSKRSIIPLPSTPKVKPTTPARASTGTKGKTAPTPSAEVIEISSSPEASPNVARTNAQDVISKRARKLEAKKREKERDKDVKVKRESMGEKGKGRASTASDVVIDLTSDKEEGDDAGGSSNKAKAKRKQSTKKPTEDKGDSDSDSDPPIDGDSDDSAEIVATVPLRRNPIQAARTGSSSSQQPSRSIADRLKKPGYSAAATRLKSLPMKRPKDGDSDDERPMKRAREAKASRGGFIPTIGTVKTRPVAASIASGSKAIDRGKRKERDDDDDSVVVKKERTLNAMGRGGRGSSTTSTVASSSKTRESGNAKTLRQRTVDLEAEPVKWPPANKHGNRKFQRDFIECDMCNGWYHYGCVGIKEDDPRIRMQDPESFMCPRCEMGRDAPHRTKEERERCGRPNCIQRAPRSNEYYVERLVGRKYSGMGASYSWLVKWDGYPLEQCTWQTEKDMAEPMKLIEAFTEAAEKEERDLGNPYKRILLSEVEKSGWIDPDK